MNNRSTLPVLYEDNDFIAVNKPPKLLVHKTELSTDRTAALQIVRNQIGQHVHPVHRLDRATSGVLLFGKSKEAHKFASGQFQEHKVKKTYLAIIRGWPAEDEGIIDSPIKKENGEEREAISHYKVLFKGEVPYQVSQFPTTRYSVVEVKPKTGRMHQIRRHMRRLTGPVIGDTTYGNSEHNHFFKETVRVPYLLLFAKELTFNNMANEEVTVTCPLAESFTKVIDFFKWPELH